MYVMLYDITYSGQEIRTDVVMLYDITYSGQEIRTDVRYAVRYNI